MASGLDDPISREITPLGTPDYEWTAISRSSTAALSESACAPRWEPGQRVSVVVKASAETLYALGAAFLTRPAFIMSIGTWRQRLCLNLSYEDGNGFVSCTLDANGDVDAVYPGDDSSETTWCYVKQDSGSWHALRTRFLDADRVDSTRFVDDVAVQRI